MTDIKPVADKAKPKQRSTSGHDGVCQYTYDDKRCPLPGNIMEAGRWYCRWHVHADNRTEGVHQHAHFRTFDRATEQGRQCILDQLADWYGGGTKHMARDIAKRHPEWQRADGESETDYRLRMIKLRKAVRAQGQNNERSKV